jgi:hypothetical protein
MDRSTLVLILFFAGLAIFIGAMLWLAVLGYEEDEAKIKAGCEPATVDRSGNVVHWKNC